MIFNHKVKKVRSPIYIYINGEKVGEVIRVVGKEVMGQPHFDMWLKFDFGAGAEEMLLDTMSATGIHIGVVGDTPKTNKEAMDNIKKIEAELNDSKQNINIE